MRDDSAILFNTSTMKAVAGRIEKIKYNNSDITFKVKKFEPSVVASVQIPEHFSFLSTSFEIIEIKPSQIVQKICILPYLNRNDVQLKVLAPIS